MSLIKCSECGKDISDQANACPHCGFPLNTKTFDNTSDLSTKSNAEGITQQSQKPGERPWRPNIDHIVVGIIMILISVYLTQSLLVKYAPPSEEKFLDSIDIGAGHAIKEGSKYYFFYTMTNKERRDYRINYNYFVIGSWTLGILGLIVLSAGLSSRAKIGFCEKCARDVVIKTSTFGKKCEICGNAIGKKRFTLIYAIVALIIVFILVMYFLLK